MTSTGTPSVVRTSSKLLKFFVASLSKSAKNLSHLGRWDGIFSRPTFFEAGGTDFSEAISRQILRI